MNREIFVNSKLVEDLGWTLLNSVWQISLMALLLFLFLRAFQNFSPQTRYLFAVSALVLAVMLPMATFVYVNGNSSSNLSNKEFPPIENGGQSGKIAPVNEIFPTSIKPETEDSKINRSNVLASLENLQNFFSERFSAALPFLVGLWFFGAMFFAVRLAGGIYQLRIYKTREIYPANDDWQKRLAALCEKLKIAPRVKLLRSNLLKTPIVAGWLKPVILVPAGVFLHISPPELEIIIAHELVHIRRWDALTNFAQSVAEVVFFYHPGVWWISRVIRREREFAADREVVKIFQNSRIIYASALANLEEIRLLTNQKLPPFATAASGGNLMQRITKILQKETGRKHRKSAWSAIVALALLPAVLLSVFSFNERAFVNAQTKTKNTIAVGFVSIPPVDRTANPPKDADATARLLIEKLKSHRVPAIGFLQGAMISDGEKLYPVRANIVRLWRDAGFELGIGNFKHVWFYETPYNEYLAGVGKNKQIAEKLLAEKNLPLRYFSYPFLNTGKNADERGRFETWLQTQGLTPVKYTIDNQEWMYSYAYDMARNDNDVSTMVEIRVEFVKYMARMFDHYETYSREMFGRDIAQTMVLTPSRLVTDSADDLFGMIEKRGYQFVSMEEALSDAAYQTPENFYGKSGISWFERWQMAEGKRLLDEPPVSDNVQKIWEESRAKK